MLSEATFTRLAAIAKLDVNKLKESILSPDEMVLDIDETITGFSKGDLETRDKNTYARDKKTGEEMAFKALKEKHGLDVVGNDPDKIVEAISAKIKKEINEKPDVRISEAEKARDQAIATMKVAIERADKTEATNKENTLNNKILSSFPKNRMDNISDEEYLVLTKSRIKIEERDGREVAIRDGAIVADGKTMEPLSVKDAIDGMFAERKWIKEAGQATQQQAGQQGGRGGIDSKLPTTGNFKTLSEVQSYVEKSGKNIQGSQGRAMIEAALKENPNIDLMN